MSYIYPTQTHEKIGYKAYFVFNQKKIYLGIYASKANAQFALEQATELTKEPFGSLSLNLSHIPYKKALAICNLRDHKVYFKNPIYIYSTYFCYYLSKDIFLTFDLKDLLFFSTYKIYKRGNYLYTQDSISQQNLLSRFGIPNHSVQGKDYLFKNGNVYDFRRENLEIINSYKGVTKKEKDNQTYYVASIYTDKNIIIGHYHSELEAAIAYNKAIDLLEASTTLDKSFVSNVIPFLTTTEYQELYNAVSISPRIKNPHHSRKRALGLQTYRGISKTPSGYRVNIGYAKKQIYLGIYPTEKRAAQAYNFASFYLFGQSGHINDITPLIHDSDAEKIAGHLAKHVTK